MRVGQVEQLPVKEKAQDEHPWHGNERNDGAPAGEAEGGAPRSRRDVEATAAAPK